ncbi:MAG TPA: hypothetical protein VIG44_05880, partial [Thermomicrobiales bacterium]
YRRRRSRSGGDVARRIKRIAEKIAEMNRQYCPEGARKDAKREKTKRDLSSSHFLGVLAGALWAVLAV